jgi:putative transcriptional regulator
MGGQRLAFIRVGRPVEGLRPGIIIRSTDQIGGGIFSNSRILIARYSPQEGALGFIINKRISNTNSDLGNNIPIFIGGPVSYNNTFAIHSDPNVEGSTPVNESIFLGGRIIPDILHHNLMIIKGYAGWGPRQLDGEFRAGSWTIEGEATVENVFEGVR